MSWTDTGTHPLPLLPPSEHERRDDGFSSALLRVRRPAGHRGDLSFPTAEGFPGGIRRPKSKMQGGGEFKTCPLLHFFPPRLYCIVLFFFFPFHGLKGKRRIRFLRFWYRKTQMFGFP